jgi:aminopeptidase
MLNRNHLYRYADVLIWGLHTARSKPFKKGDIILIRYHTAGLGLAEILHARILSMGMHPVMRQAPTAAMEKNLYMLAGQRQLVFQPPGSLELYQNLNGSIFVHAPESITHLSRVDPKKIGRYATSLKPLRDIMDLRDAQGQFGWTLCMLPTEELSRHAQLSLEQYSAQIIKACWLHRRDPVGEWKRIFAAAQEVKKWLNAMSIARLHIESDNMDLMITPGLKRRWVGISGHNIPSFELFLSPDWRGTQGVYYANLPSYRSGNMVAGVRIQFERGKAVTIQATKGEQFAQQQLRMDQGASKVGEFSLTDKRFSKIDHFMANTLFDENYGGPHGNCHVALGSSYTDTYDGPAQDLSQALKKSLGFNESALHWDLVNTERKRVTAHLSSGAKVTIYENGEFTY